MGSLGDVVRGLTVADAIKQQLPGVKITWLVEPKCRGIVDLSLSVDEVIEFDRVRPLSGILALRKIFKQRSFDIVLDMQRHVKSGFFGWLTGAPRRIGFHRKNAKEFNWLFQTEYIPADNNDGNKFYLYQKFLLALGLTESSSPILKLRCDPEEEQYRGLSYAFIVMGSSWSSKNWVLEGYQKLISALLREGYGAVLVGGKKDDEIAAQLVTYHNDGRLFNYCGKTSLAQLLAIIKGAKVGIGPDSGPGHLASAVGVSYVSLFGPTAPKRVAPIGSEDLVVTASVGCSPCYRRECPGLNKICMRLLSVPRIMEKVSIVKR